MKARRKVITPIVIIPHFSGQQQQQVFPDDVFFFEDYLDLDDFLVVFDLLLMLPIRALFSSITYNEILL